LRKLVGYALARAHAEHGGDFYEQFEERLARFLFGDDYGRARRRRRPPGDEKQRATAGQWTRWSDRDHATYLVRTWLDAWRRQLLPPRRRTRRR